MRKEFAVPLSRPNHLWRREAAVGVFVCVVGRHVIPGFWGLIKELRKGDTRICVLISGRTDVSFLRWNGVSTVRITCCLS